MLEMISKYLFMQDFLVVSDVSGFFFRLMVAKNVLKNVLIINKHGAPNKCVLVGIFVNF